MVYEEDHHSQERLVNIVFSTRRGCRAVGQRGDEKALDGAWWSEQTCLLKCMTVLLVVLLLLSSLFETLGRSTHHLASATAKYVRPAMNSAINSAVILGKLEAYYYPANINLQSTFMISHGHPYSSYHACFYSYQTPIKLVL